MKNNNSWETLVSIVVSVFLFWISFLAFLWVSNIYENNIDIYYKNIYNSTLSHNSNNALKYILADAITNDIFYLDDDYNISYDEKDKYISYYDYEFIRNCYKINIIYDVYNTHCEIINNN